MNNEIPEDVMKAARDLVGDYLDIADSRNAQLARFVAFAILAERERCARVSYAYADDHSGDHKMVGHIIGRKILYGSP